jgi:hypothetical protein
MQALEALWTAARLWPPWTKECHLFPARQTRANASNGVLPVLAAFLALSTAEWQEYRCCPRLTHG